MELTGTNQPCGLTIFFACKSLTHCCCISIYPLLFDYLSFWYKRRMKENCYPIQASDICHSFCCRHTKLPTYCRLHKVWSLRVTLESRQRDFALRFSVAIARRSHPFPFRSRQLSSSAPMVLPGRLGGRVGRRRILFYRNPPFRYGWGIFLCRPSKKSFFLNVHFACLYAL